MAGNIVYAALISLAGLFLVADNIQLQREAKALSQRLQGVERGSPEDRLDVPDEGQQPSTSPTQLGIWERFKRLHDIVVTQNRLRE